MSRSSGGGVDEVWCPPPLADEADVARLFNKELLDVLFQRLEGAEICSLAQTCRVARDALSRSPNLPAFAAVRYAYIDCAGKGEVQALDPTFRFRHKFPAAPDANDLEKI